MLGFISDNRPSYMGESKLLDKPSMMEKTSTASKKVGSYIQRKTKDLIN